MDEHSPPNKSQQQKVVDRVGAKIKLKLNLPGLKETQSKQQNTQPNEVLDQDELNMRQHKNNPDLFKIYF